MALVTASGLAWFGLSGLSPASRKFLVPAKTVIGEVSEARGEASLASGSAPPVPIETPLKLRIGDVVSTTSGAVTIAFATGERVRMEGSARLTIDPLAGDPHRFVLSLEGGTLSLTTPPQAGSGASLRVLRAGLWQDLGDPSLTARERAPRMLADARAAEAAASAVDDSASPDATASGSQQRAGGDAPEHDEPKTLAEADIARAMHSQAGFFRRCALSYFERVRLSGVPAASGERKAVVMSFTVQPNGHAVDARATSGELDPQLRKCLTDVVERVPFHRFAGPPIPIAEYPVQIE